MQILVASSRAYACARDLFPDMLYSGDTLLSAARIMCKTWLMFGAACGNSRRWHARKLQLSCTEVIEAFWPSGPCSSLTIGLPSPSFLLLKASTSQLYRIGFRPSISLTGAFELWSERALELLGLQCTSVPDDAAGAINWSRQAYSPKERPAQSPRKDT